MLPNEAYNIIVQSVLTGRFTITGNNVSVTVTMFNLAYKIV